MRYSLFAKGLFLLSLSPQCPADVGIESVSLAAAYTGELLSNRSGGLQQATAYVDNLDLTLSVDGAGLWGWPAATEIFVYGVYNNGAPFSETVVGDLQVVSNIETGVDAFRLFEAWLRMRTGSRSDLLFGLYDLNSEFDVLEASQIFAGSAHGIGTDISQSGLNGPSIFPFAGLALRVAHGFNDHWTLRGALIDGVPGDPERPGRTSVRLSSDEGALLVGELEWSNATSRVLTGLWAYTAKFDEDPFNTGVDVPPPRRGNVGAYLRGETIVFDSDSRLATFGRIGYARGDFNAFEYFLSAGATWRGMTKGRPQDEAGIAVAWAETSGSLEKLLAPLPDVIDSREVALELTYRAPVGDRLVLQPTIHYVVNPGINPALSNALAFALRFEITLL